MKKFPKKIHVICRKIVANYNKAIRTKDFSGWVDYGSSGSCLLCVEFGLAPRTSGSGCCKCPLGPESIGCLCGGTSIFPGRATHNDLIAAIFFGKIYDIVPAARARLRYLKRRFKMAGIDLKPRKSERRG